MAYSTKRYDAKTALRNLEESLLKFEGELDLHAINLRRSTGVLPCDVEAAAVLCVKAESFAKQVSTIERHVTESDDGALRREKAASSALRLRLSAAERLLAGLHDTLAESQDESAGGDGDGIDAVTCGALADDIAAFLDRRDEREEHGEPEFDVPPLRQTARDALTA